MKVGIVGASFAGLAAATRLVELGHAVTLFERHPCLGGTAGSLNDEDSAGAPQLRFGCHRATHAFLRRIGTRDAEPLEMGLLDPDGRSGSRSIVLVPPGRLRGPLALLGCSALPLADRLRSWRLAASAFAPSSRRPAASDYETVEHWLDRLGQSEAARRRLWRPLTRAALHDEPRTASAKLLETVLREAFFSGPAEADLILTHGQPAVRWAEHARAHLQRHGAVLRLSTFVRTLEVQGGVVRGVRLESGEVLACDAVIAAVPPPALQALVPASARAQEPYFEGLGHLTPSPVVSVQLGLDRPVTDGPLLTLVDRPLHWIFDGNEPGARRPLAPHPVCLQASTATALVDPAPDDLIALALNELQIALPAALGARLLTARVFKHHAGSFSHPVGGERHRPRSRSPIEGLFVVGNFVRTGLPATAESGARSAEDAVQLVQAYAPPPVRTMPSGPFVPLQRIRGGLGLQT